MKFRFSLLARFTILAFPLFLNAQQPVPSGTAAAVVPRLVNFSGTAVNAQGKPLSGTAGITFSIYKDQIDGAPLWMETQNIQADSKGKLQYPTLTFNKPGATGAKAGDESNFSKPLDPRLAGASEQSVDLV